MIMKKFMVSLMVLFFVVSGSSFALESNFGLGCFVPYFKKPFDDSEVYHWYPRVISKVKTEMSQYSEENKEEFVDLIVGQMKAWNHKLYDVYENAGGIDTIREQLLSQSYAEIVADIKMLGGMYDRGKFIIEIRDAVSIPAYVIAILFGNYALL